MFEGFIVVSFNQASLDDLVDTVPWWAPVAVVAMVGVTFLMVWAGKEVHRIVEIMKEEDQEEGRGE